jgi:hypothetical protein
MVVGFTIIDYKNVFGPIAVLVTNHFRIEQKSSLPLKLQFMSGFGKTTIFNGLLAQLCIFIEPINTRFLHVLM